MEVPPKLMTVHESKALKKDTRIYWRGDPTAALSPKRVGMRSRSPGTMAGWPEYTAETCANFSERRQSRILCSGSRTNPLPRCRGNSHNRPGLCGSTKPKRCYTAPDES
jgi:hypothetical protein